MTWVEAKANEKKVGKIKGKQPGKGETWVPVYDSIADILAEYGAGPTEPGAPIVPPEDVAAVIAALEAEQGAQF